MFKSIVKEIFIMLLLCLAIVLILGVIFYNYIPTNKTIPEKLATYTTPENINEKIEEQISETEKEEITYEIEAADLKLYKQTNSYTTGKRNPFVAVSTEVENKAENNTNNEQNENNNQQTDNNTNINDDSKNTLFYNKTDTK